MTPNEVQRRVLEIHEKAWKQYTHPKLTGGDWDDEVAHSLEDTLHQDVLRAIAEGECEEPSACARLVLTTRTYDFSRWCA